MDSVQVLSWLLMCMTVVNLALVAEKRREGFIVGIVSQPIWLVFDALTGAYGLMPLAVILGALYVRGWIRWGQIDRKAAAVSVPNPLAGEGWR